ncbi:MAG: helix-turn-helix transcriptional regulator [Deltaproteobacteria bacterium]|nr:helix-turn-helix transcriptional regulator [Deltaproteobacteria bacterium]
MKSKNLSRADVARLAGLSPAAVTKWFREVNPEGRVNVESRTLFRLASSLGIPAENLLKPTANLAPYQTEFLWDRLYPSMEDFIFALIQDRPSAIARLVQQVGFYEASKIIGKKAISLFDRYRRFIHPVRRKQLEVLWPLYL